jgi:nitroreductase
MREKPAQTKYPIHQLIKNRWSPVCFDPDKTVEPEKISSLLEAARWAASCFNEQPWNFIVATKDNQEEYQKLFSCILEGNQKWVKNVPVLMMAVAKLNFTHNNKPNRHAFHDVGLALGNLILQAETMSLRVHCMAGFDPEKTKEIYNIPENFEAITAIAIGYQGDVQKFAEELQQRDNKPRSRKSFDDFVFRNNWGISYFS